MEYTAKRYKLVAGSGITLTHLPFGKLRITADVVEGGGGDMLAANNLSDLVSAATARMNLGLNTTANQADSTNKRFVSDAQEAKIDFISITQAVDLDDIETRVNNLDAAVVLKGVWDASAGTFPGGGTAQAGASYIVSVAGTVDSVAFAIGDRAIAILDNASTTTFAANWFKADYTDQVLSVNGATGAVIVQATLVSETNIKTINSQSILGSGNLTVSAAITETEIDVGATPVAEASIAVTDAGVTASSKIIGGVAYKVPTGKDLDELEMDALDIKFEPGTGTFNVKIKGLEGYISDKFIIWYQVAA